MLLEEADIDAKLETEKDAVALRVAARLLLGQDEGLGQDEALPVRRGLKLR